MTEVLTKYRDPTKRYAQMRAHSRAAAKRRRLMLHLLKLMRGCDLCDTRDGGLDFHHRAGEARSFHPMRTPLRSLEALAVEIAKCRVLCKACHHGNLGPEDERHLTNRP
jgi:hypothetical protein